jgi:two-component system, sensor histidine kinase RegB
LELNEAELFQDHQRAGWVRLQTLVLLRWGAVAGQIGATIAAVTVFRLQIEVGLVVLTIGASILVNLLIARLFPHSRRLSERQATLMLAFDVLQLGVLLYLTGGLDNPFALLILVPATIAATLLHLRAMVLLAMLTITVISLAARWHLPILTESGQEMHLPDVLRFGFWVALVIGVVFLTLYARQVTSEMNAMSEALVATQLALAREQKLTDLGGVVAAAAHELGTPLATIKLVAAELAAELSTLPDARDDALLIGAQADRCRDILRSMGRSGKDDLHLRMAPLETVVNEAAEPHRGRGKPVRLLIAPEVGERGEELRQPVIQRRPEIIHGLRNLIQNATDFARGAVDIAISWSERTVTVRIEDDGPGFPLSVIPRIGDPFVRRRRTGEDRALRPGYEGMGLGLFIAKTLLERSGARLTFANGTGTGEGGAIVEVVWPRDRLEPPAATATGLGRNQPIRV